MFKLSEETHQFMNRNALKALRQINVFTVLQFIECDNSRLSRISGLTLPNIILLKSVFRHKYSGKYESAGTLHQRLEKAEVLRTGTHCLDLIIPNGLPKGVFTEICGLTGVGKTQLCLAIAINVAQSKGSNVLFIDTKGDFSAITAQSILRSRGLSDQETAFILNKIKIIRIWNMYELIIFFHQLADGKVSIENLHLIIIDSLPMLMYQYNGVQSKQGLTLLNSFVNISNFVCNTRNIPLVVVNILTRWVDLSIPENDGAQTADNSEFISSRRIEKKYRSLGKYWQHIPALVLQLDADENHPKCINISIVKASMYACGMSCLLNFGQSGIT